MGDPWWIDRVAEPPTWEQQEYVLKALDISLSQTQRIALRSRARCKLVAGGERGGKSYYTALEVVSRVPWSKLIWIVGERYEDTHKEFDYALDWLIAMGAVNKRDVTKPQRLSWRAKLKTGQVIETKAGADVSHIRSDAPNGICLVESATSSLALFLKCFGRLSEKRGWLVCSGTFEGEGGGWYQQLYHEFSGPNEEFRGRAFSLPTWGNLVIFPGGRTDAEILRLERIFRRVPGMFEERVAGIPAPASTLVFRDYSETTHLSTAVSYKAGMPVYLGIDPSDGGHPYAVVAVQFYSDPWADMDDPIDVAHVVDQFWETGVIDEDVITECAQREWWKDVRGGAIDVEAPDSRKRWAMIGGVHLQASKIPQLEGIRRLHSFLAFDPSVDMTPHLLIPGQPGDPGMGYGLRYEFPRYKRKTVAMIDGELPPEVPPSNQPCDAIKASWYLLVARYGPVRYKPLPPPSVGQFRGGPSTRYISLRRSVRPASVRALPAPGSYNAVARRVIDVTERRKDRRRP